MKLIDIFIKDDRYERSLTERERVIGREDERDRFVYKINKSLKTHWDAVILNAVIITQNNFSNETIKKQNAMNKKTIKLR